MQVRQNPNKTIADEVKKRLKENDNYCPCKLTRTPDTRCMCKEFRDMLIQGVDGMCHCGLYVVTHDE